MSRSDADDLVKRDVEKIQRLAAADSQSIGVAETLELILWIAAFLTVVAMIVVLPLGWVGPDALLTGEMWLGYSIVTLFLTGGVAVIVRLVRINAPLDDESRMGRRGYKGGGR